MKPRIVAGPVPMVARVHGIHPLDSPMRTGEPLLAIAISPQHGPITTAGGGINAYWDVPIGGTAPPAILCAGGVSQAASSTGGMTLPFGGWGLWVKPWGPTQAAPETWPGLVIEAVAQSWEAIATETSDPHRMTRRAVWRETKREQRTMWRRIDHEQIPAGKTGEYLPPEEALDKLAMDARDERVWEAEDLLDALVRQLASNDLLDRLRSVLTNRQFEVAERLAKGMRPSDITGDLRLKEVRGIYQHIDLIRKKIRSFMT